MKSPRLTIASILIIMLLGGCNRFGTAVILWPPENSRWEPGDVAKVKNESLLRDTYIVVLPEQRRLKEEIDRWRLRLFSREKEAVAWAASMREWRQVYAECLYQGLPMRLEPDNTVVQVYRFREGDMMKVLNREPGPVKVGNLEGYWYSVLAEGGVKGYVFDHHLRVMRVSGDQREILNPRNTENTLLAEFLAATWRPEYFGDMIRDRRIDLNFFRPEYGLFLDTENRTLTLNLPHAPTVVGTWTEIVRAGGNRYDFLGAGVRVTMNPRGFVSVQYTVDGVEGVEVFVQIDQNIDTIIEEEIARRQAVLARLLEEGPVYDSRSYGELTIEEDGNFIWIGKSALISRNILTPEAGNRGVLEFNIFLDPALQTAHEGVLSLRFGNGEAVRFLYAFETRGLRFLHVPEAVIERGEVQSDQFINPVSLFFTPRPPDSANLDN